MKRGPWFPANVKPVRVGWYETRLTKFMNAYRAYWDGRYWRWQSRGSACVMQHRQWRGLLK